jgi:hypothetical protein
MTTDSSFVPATSVTGLATTGDHRKAAAARKARHRAERERIGIRPVTVDVPDRYHAWIRDMARRLRSGADPPSVIGTISMSQNAGSAGQTQPSQMPPTIVTTSEGVPFMSEQKSPFPYYLTPGSPLKATIRLRANTKVDGLAEVLDNLSAHREGTHHDECWKVTLQNADHLAALETAVPPGLADIEFRWTRPRPVPVAKLEDTKPAPPPQ